MTDNKGLVKLSYWPKSGRVAVPEVLTIGGIFRDPELEVEGRIHHVKVTEDDRRPGRQTIDLILVPARAQGSEIPPMEQKQVIVTLYDVQVDTELRVI